MTSERQILRYDPSDLRFHDRTNLWRGRCAVANGCFDLLHPGHLRVLEHLSDICDAHGLFPIVLLNSDGSVRRSKGTSRPVVPEESRATLLTRLVWPLSVVIFDQDTPLEAMQHLRPSIVVKGGDYRPQDVVVSDGATVRIVPYVNGWSTTGILERR